MNSIIRPPCVAGSFYPGTEIGIREQLQKIKDRVNYHIPSELKINRIFGGVLPHAGHVYSAYQTLSFFETLLHFNVSFDSFLLLHPLHHGGKLEFAGDASGFWETPLGRLKVDNEFINAMETEISSDMLAFEHSAEVILPYIQFYGFEDKMIIPIGIATQTPDVSRRISAMLNKAQSITGREICVIASSDFSHFLSPDEGSRQDQKVLDCMQQKDIDCVYKSIISNRISVCGYGPIMSLMEYSKSISSNYQSRILSRGHSGEVSPSDSVVDYISMLFFD